jgi:two-component system OmpR family response regulator
MRVMIVEDDRELARRLAAALRSRDFIVDSVPDAEAALDWPDPDGIAVLIVDLGLPGISGLDLVRRWRRDRRVTPILVLTARGAWEDKVAGLNAGADDFVVKPARAEEIVARIHALMRRSAGQLGPDLHAGPITIDTGARQVRLNGEAIEVTQTEYRLLLLFIYRAGRILTQGEILDQLYPLDRERDANTVEVYISRLRRKIGANTITTVRGLGYRFEK